MILWNPKLDLRNEHVTRFGYPISQNGALYVVSDHIGLFQASFDIEKYNMYKNGIPVTLKSEIQILRKIEQLEENLVKNYQLKGIPINLIGLLTITKKSEVEKFIKTLVVNESELFLLILNCDQINFLHKAKFPEYVPEHLQIQNTDKSEMLLGKFKKVSTKLKSLMEQRRHIHVHGFQRGNEWHCFYFTYDDIEDNRDNHWKFGPHLHYVSYLWPDYDYGEIMQKFDIRKTDIPGDIHIKFTPYNFPDARDERLYPQPYEQIATRGSFILNIALRQ